MESPTSSPLQQRRRSSVSSTRHFWRKIRSPNNSNNYPDDNTFVVMNTTDSNDDAFSQVELADTSSSSWQSTSMMAEDDDDGYFPLLGSPLSLDTSDDDDTAKFNAETNHARASSSTTAVSVSWFKKLWSEMPPQSVLLLNAVAIIWGTQHAVIKLVVEDSSVGSFTLLRFALAAILASPYTPGLPSFFHSHSTVEHSKDGDEGEDEKMTESMTLTMPMNSNSSTLASVRTAWRWGVEMGFWMFLGFAFQAVGLETTTAQRSGFLLYLNVKFVPFLARILLGRQISIPTWVSAFVAFFGTALLAISGSHSGDSSAAAGLALNAGDWWSIAAAAASAMFILRLESASVQVPSSAQLNAACLWTVTLFSLIWSLGQTATMELWQEPSLVLSQHQQQPQLMLLPSLHNMWYSWISQLEHLATTHAAELVYLGGVTTALANYVQTKAQKDVSAERASVIYAMDPVYGAFFSYLLLGEVLTGWGIVGAALIAVAAATNAFVDFGGTDKKTTPSS